MPETKIAKKKSRAGNKLQRIETKTFGKEASVEQEHKKCRESY